MVGESLNVLVITSNVNRMNVSLKNIDGKNGFKKKNLRHIIFKRVMFKTKAIYRAITTKE